LVLMLGLLILRLCSLAKPAALLQFPVSSAWKNLFD